MRDGQRFHYILKQVMSPVNAWKVPAAKAYTPVVSLAEVLDEELAHKLHEQEQGGLPEVSTPTTFEEQEIDEGEVPTELLVVKRPNIPTC